MSVAVNIRIYCRLVGMFLFLLSHTVVLTALNPLSAVVIIEISLGFIQTFVYFYLGWHAKSGSWQGARHSGKNANVSS